jgi:hypothetical protein
VQAASVTDWDAFLAVVCGDDQWVRAEFDAIVAVSFRPPPPRRPAGSGGPGRGFRRLTGGTCHGGATVGCSTAADASARQRSPPRKREVLHHDREGR